MINFFFFCIEFVKMSLVFKKFSAPKRDPFENEEHIKMIQALPSQERARIREVLADAQNHAKLMEHLLGEAIRHCKTANVDRVAINPTFIAAAKNAGIQFHVTTDQKILLGEMRTQERAMKCRRKSYGFHLSNMEFEDAESAVKTEFASDFWKWLSGRGLPKDIARTKWGAKPLKFPDVIAYLDSFVELRFQFLTKLKLLEFMGPTDLPEAYLYFKYIVRGEADDKFGLGFLSDWDKLIMEVPKIERYPWTTPEIDRAAESLGGKINPVIDAFASTKALMNHMSGPVTVPMTTIATIAQEPAPTPTPAPTPVPIEVTTTTSGPAPARPAPSEDDIPPPSAIDAAIEQIRQLDTEMVDVAGVREPTLLQQDPPPPPEEPAGDAMEEDTAHQAERERELALERENRERADREAAEEQARQRHRQETTDQLRNEMSQSLEAAKTQLREEAARAEQERNNAMELERRKQEETMRQQLTQHTEQLRQQAEQERARLHDAAQQERNNALELERRKQSELIQLQSQLLTERENVSRREREVQSVVQNVEHQITQLTPMIQAMQLQQLQQQQSLPLQHHTDPPPPIVRDIGLKAAKKGIPNSKGADDPVNLQSTSTSQNAQEVADLILSGRGHEIPGIDRAVYPEPVHEVAMPEPVQEVMMPEQGLKREREGDDRPGKRRQVSAADAAEPPPPPVAAEPADTGSDDNQSLAGQATRLAKERGYDDLTSKQLGHFSAYEQIPLDHAVAAMKHNLQEWQSYVSRNDFPTGRKSAKNKTQQAFIKQVAKLAAPVTEVPTTEGFKFNHPETETASGAISHQEEAMEQLPEQPYEMLSEQVFALLDDAGVDDQTARNNILEYYENHADNDSIQEVIRMWKDEKGDRKKILEKLRGK